jgi:undecaprenyl-diphosphatase
MNLEQREVTTYTRLKEEASQDRLWRRRTLCLVGGLLVFRLIFTAVVPLDLVHDEAYYWDWSRQLDWGYYSKPPMIAWLIALSTRLLGSTPLAVRLPSVLLGTGGLLLVYLLATRMYGSKAGFWAALLSAATPGNTALGLLMTIDAPFLFCWSASLYCLWRFLQPGANRPLWLLAGTLATGLGILSKQTMLGFIPLSGLFLLTGRDDRREFLRPSVWMWALGGLLFLAPVIWWNWQHDWITVQHTGGHFAGEDVTLWKRLSRFGEFIASQFGVVSPVTCGLCIAAGALGLGHFRRLARRERFLICFSAVPMVGVLCLALTQRVEANWPAAFYPAAVILMVGWALGQLPTWRALGDGARSLRQAAIAGALCVLVTYAASFGCGLQGSKLDPAVRLRGWREVGQQMGAALDGMPRPRDTFLLFVTSRAPASEAAFYMPQQPRVHVWSSSGDIDSQYDIWGGPQGKDGWDAMIVSSPKRPLPPELHGQFDAIEPAGEVQVPIGHGRRHVYHVWRGVNYRQANRGVRVAGQPESRWQR